MSTLCINQLKKILGIMHLMKQQIIECNWEELSRLDSERREIILDESETCSKSIGVESTVDETASTIICECCTSRIQNEITQHIDEKAVLVNQIRVLDKEILENSLLARSTLLNTSRKFSSQQKAKNLYAESCTQVR